MVDKEGQWSVLSRNMIEIDRAEVSAGAVGEALGVRRSRPWDTSGSGMEASLVKLVQIRQ